MPRSAFSITKSCGLHGNPETPTEAGKGQAARKAKVNKHHINNMRDTYYMYMYTYI